MIYNPFLDAILGFMILTVGGMVMLVGFMVHNLSKMILNLTTMLKLYIDEWAKLQNVHLDRELEAAKQKQQ